MLQAIESIPEPEEDKGGESPLCWVVNIETKQLKWLYWDEQSKCTDFVDPFAWLFGMIRRRRLANTRRILNKYLASDEGIR